MVSHIEKGAAVAPLLLLALGLGLVSVQRPLRRWLRRRRAVRVDARAFARRYGRAAHARVAARIAEEPDARMARHLSRVLRRLPPSPPGALEALNRAEARNGSAPAPELHAEGLRSAR